ncbi:MAG: ISL3 family transposase [Dehalococcoidia bacterium]
MRSAFVVGVNFVEAEDRVELLVKPHGNRKLRCPSEGCKRCMTPTGDTERRNCRHLDVLSVRCYLVWDARYGRCPEHGVRLEELPWAAPRARHSRQFDRAVAKLVQVADKSATARMFGVAWRTVERVVRRVVHDELPKDLFDDLVAIGVDETSYKRGHRYLTVVSDLMTGNVIWIGEGKGADTLNQFFDELGATRCAKLQLVSMDMSGSYKKAVADKAKDAEIVFDRFHVVRLLLDAVDEVRRDEAREMPVHERRRLKGQRFQLLRNPKFREPDAVEATRKAVSGNRRIARAYELRISFEDFWECETEEDAERFLFRWTRSALMSRQRPLRRVAKTLREHADGILAYFRWWGQTNAVLEGTNNKIKLLIHKAYGFRSVAGLMAMIHLCCSGITLLS